MEFRVASNLSHNEGQHTGLFVVQDTASFSLEKPRKTIELGIEKLTENNYPGINTFIPIIADELFMSGAIQLVASAQKLGMGSIVTFGVESEEHGSYYRNRHGLPLRSIQSHLGIVAIEQAADHKDFLVPLLRPPRGTRLEREKLYSKLEHLHLKVGTMTVKDHKCKLELLDC